MPKEADHYFAFALRIKSRRPAGSPEHNFMLVSEIANKPLIEFGHKINRRRKVIMKGSRLSHFAVSAAILVLASLALARPQGSGYHLLNKYSFGPAEGS